MNPSGWFFLGYLLSDSSKKRQGNHFPILQRIVAAVVDLLIIKATVYVGVFSINYYDFSLLQNKISIMILTLTPILLFSYMESTKIRATPGKLLLGLVSVDLHGMQLKLSKGIYRNLLKWLPLFIPTLLLLGFSRETFVNIWFLINGIVVWLGWSSIQDKFIGTAVISRPSYFTFYYSDPKYQIYWLNE